MHKDFYGWSLESSGNGTVDTKYIVEYIDNKDVWDKFSRSEDMSLYYKREYDNIESALEFYMVHYVANDCFDIKMWEQIFVNGEMVLEQFVEPKSTTRYVMERVVKRDLRDRVDRQKNELKILRESVLHYESFMDAMGSKFKELFDEFVEKNFEER